MENVTLKPGQWLEERAGYTRGQIMTDIPEFGLECVFVDEVYIPETGQTQVYETWLCE